MKRYAFVDWDLVHSTPVRHTYRCGWRELLLGSAICPSTCSARRRQVTLEWDGKDQLLVRSGRLWPNRSQWSNDQLRGITFGLRELDPKGGSASNPPGWLWFIQLNAKGGGPQLAEFLVAYQTEAPSTSRARVPARVQELLNWLGQCTGHRPHGPILVTDEASRKRILAARRLERDSCCVDACS